MEAAVDHSEADEEAKHLVAIESLSEQLRLPLETVAEVYGRELARIREDALITTYLSIFVSRRVDEMLRAAPGPAHPEGRVSGLAH